MMPLPLRSFQTCDGAAEPRQPVIIELLPCEGRQFVVGHPIFFGHKNAVRNEVLLSLLRCLQVSCMSSRALTSNYGWFPHQ